jgi:hypothetical protein
MKKIVAFVVILVMAISLSAQFKTGMDFRTRAEMYNMNYDVAVWQRITDLRFKPWMTYTQNDYLTAKWEIEIGDIGFGVDNSKTAGNDGAIGTDGVNVETKSLFLQISPNKENTVIVGLQPYKDFHALLLDSDIAGISWKSKRDLGGKDFTSYLGWFVSADNNEYSVDESTYSFGSTEIVADFDYKLNDKMKFGMNNIFQFVRNPTANPDIHETSFNMWIAPYFAGTFDKFYAEAVFGMNNIHPEFETFNDAVDNSYNPKHSGLVFSLKTKYNVNEEVDARFNFLFRGGDELGGYDPEGGFEHYYGIKSYYSTGLEILTEQGCGLDGDGQVFSPVSYYPYYSKGLYANGHAGIILPAIFVDYKVKNIKEKMSFMNSLKLTLGLGYAVTAAEIKRVTGDDGVARPESAIGTELNLKAEMQMFDDLYVMPYYAVLFPGEWYNYENDHDHSFTKIGLALKTKLK